MLSGPIMLKSTSSELPMVVCSSTCVNRPTVSIISYLKYPIKIRPIERIDKSLVAIVWTNVWLFLYIKIQIPVFFNQYIDYQVLLYSDYVIFDRDYETIQLFYMMIICCVIKSVFF
ncbi:hypothetical protein BDA99DRAFT_537478 [Phascolomyces articulosus]|uniref:Uncharacterized protein n=1 Tax=Phascolomyces articulosus TaxID=60185 RepID=A0AAD5PDC1_9FUNG|nr:hypothetical protein BDA99DRAFT_537478 [Phascolomyces articulosus]